ncbi:energy transducer TonB [candidate division KSB1 bacterium]|nr:energy transducer TonB [candidate division KSB1 bacterium]MBL7093216.1 energy transducer TonB [candidate division KSB1 bacterium]
MHNRIFPLAIIFSIILGCAATSSFKPPILLGKFEPEYPRKAREEGLEGSVELYLLLNKSGNVIQSKISKSSRHKILDNAAIEYANKLKFDPATRKGIPISVTLSWLVNYESEDVYFVPLVYVAEVQDFFKRAAQLNGEEKNRILQQIIYAHEEYARHLSDKSHLNYNKDIQKFVKPEVYECWQDLWQYWPLRFVVFHDFILRYPDSEHVSYATARLLSLLKDDIGRIKYAAQYEDKLRQKKDLFLKTIYTFLNNEYPKAITEDLKVEAAQYIKK